MRLPEVTTLGPVLFLFHIIDLTTAFKKVTSIHFVKFTVLSLPTKKLSTIQSSTLIKTFKLDDFTKGYVRKGYT